MSDKINKIDEEWRQELTPEQYEVLRNKATEQPFTGKYDAHNEAGEYVCAGCGEKLFSSEDKYDAHCGWPSFSQTATEKGVSEEEDGTLGVSRTEVLCTKCGGHLGHVFNDGPTQTGLRYCINSVSLDFKKK